MSSMPEDARNHIDDAYNRGFERGVFAERERIIKLLKDRHTMTLDENANILAFRISVDRKSAALVTEALIWAIEGEDVLIKGEQK